MKSSNRSLAIKLVLAAFGMFGFAFGMVPFYERICEITGINNLMRADKNVVNTQVDTSRKVLIQFDGNTTQSLAWRFKPLQNNLSFHPGELIRIDYEVENTQDRPVTGQAIPSYTPLLSAQYVKKLECFCFKQQTLGPREKRIMPVVFTLDGSLPTDINVLTLSYTFFEVAGKNG